MRSREAKKILNCSYTTLHNYVRDGKLKGKTLPNGYYDYDEESVYSLAGSFYKPDNDENRIIAYSAGKKYEFKPSD